MFHPYSFIYKNTKTQKSNESLPSHFSASPYYSTSLSISPMPQTGFYYVPFHHLGYPISPFGMSHFTIWGIPFRLLWYPISPFGVSHFAFWGIPFRLLGYIFGTFAHNVQPRCLIWLLRFSLQKHVSFLSFRFIMFLPNSLGWIKYIL